MMICVQHVQLRMWRSCNNNNVTYGFPKSLIDFFFSDRFAMLAIGNRHLPRQPCRRWCPFFWFQVKDTRERMCGPECGVLSMSADSWQRLFRNRVRRPQVGTLSEALLISGKDIPGTACAVQKTASFQCLPLSGKDLPGPRAQSLVWP